MDTDTARTGHSTTGKPPPRRGMLAAIAAVVAAALFADAIERGEVETNTRLGDIWPDLDGNVAEVTLASIAMQRSRLPKQQPPVSIGDGIASHFARNVHTDPYRETTVELIDSLRDVELGDKDPEYSNFAFAILGQALATVTDTAYADLVEQRITEPLGMTSTYVPDSADGLSHGFTASGLPAPRRPRLARTSTSPIASAGPGSRRNTAHRTSPGTTAAPAVIARSSASIPSRGRGSSSSPTRPIRSTPPPS